MHACIINFILSQLHIYIYTCLDVCNAGHIRLAGGRDASEGRVEICSNGVWGTVFYGSWDSLDAIVACRQLGLYQTYSSMYIYIDVHACSVKCVYIGIIIIIALLLCRS